MKKLILAVAVLLGLTACTDKNQQMTKLAEMSLRQSIGEGNDVKITGISEPDSAFGSNYLTPEEKKAVIGTMKKVTDQIMSRTQNMTAFDPNDTYVIGLAERQMRANSDLRQMLFDCDKKGDWSGWKVKIDYEVHDGHEQNYRAERWFFLDKEGSVIFKTMEFPLP